MRRTDPHPRERPPGAQATRRPLPAGAPMWARADNAYRRGRVNPVSDVGHRSQGGRRAGAKAARRSGVPCAHGRKGRAGASLILGARPARAGETYAAVATTRWASPARSGGRSLAALAVEYTPRQAPGPPYPPGLAAHPAHLPGRQPLRPRGSHGVVRGEWRRLYLRPGRQQRAAPPRIRRRRRPQGAPRRGRRRKDAELRRLRLRRPVRGTANAGSSPGWRPPRAASTPATSSPRSAARPAISMKISTAPAARPRTSSSCTRASSPPTGPPARARSPTSSASSCTPRPTG